MENRVNDFLKKIKTLNNLKEFDFIYIDYDIYIFKNFELNYT